MLCVAGDSAGDERADGAMESRGVKRKISLTCCDVCENEEAKYRCPNCLRFSCSLPCVKRHKLQSGCSGVRDKTAFVALSQFSEINLLNDYRYLEETARVADKPIRDTILHTPHHITYPVKMLKKNAAAAKVNLRLLPRSFTRHKENKSGYVKAEKKLYWHLKLHFPQSSAEYTDRVPEDRVLQQILSDYIHPTESDPVKRQRLKLYVLTPPDQMYVFLKSEQRRPGSPKFHELNLNKTLRENLMFKTILEYPELHVVLKEHRKEYLTKFPERRSAGQSSSLKESSVTGIIPQLAPSSSRDDPAEYPQHVVKKRKSMTEESELEEGEIRSEEEEEEENEDEQPKQSVCSADHTKVQNGHSMDADRSDDLLNDDNDDGDGGHNDQGGGADDQSSAMETNDPTAHDQGEEDDAVDAPDVNKNQNVFMETDDRCLHDGREEYNDNEDCKNASVEDHLLPSFSQDKDMGSGGDGDVQNNDHNDGLHQGAIKTSANDKSITMELNDPPSSNDQGREDEDAQTVDDIKYASSDNVHIFVKEAKSNPSSPQNTDQNSGSYDHQRGPADDQSRSMEAAEASPPPCDGAEENKGQIDGGTDGSAAADSAVGAIGEDLCKGGDEDGQGQIQTPSPEQKV